MKILILLGFLLGLGFPAPLETEQHALAADSPQENGRSQALMQTLIAAGLSREAAEEYLNINDPASPADLKTTLARMEVWEAKYGAILDAYFTRQASEFERNKTVLDIQMKIGTEVEATFSRILEAIRAMQQHASEGELNAEKLRLWREHVDANLAPFDRWVLEAVVGYARMLKETDEAGFEQALQAAWNDVTTTTPRPLENQTTEDAIREYHSLLGLPERATNETLDPKYMDDVSPEEYARRHMEWQAKWLSVSGMIPPREVFASSQIRSENKILDVASSVVVDCCIASVAFRQMTSQAHITPEMSETWAAHLLRMRDFAKDIFFEVVLTVFDDLSKDLDHEITERIDIMRFLKN